MAGESSIDHGYAWIIAFCGFFLQGIGTGMIYIMGVYLPEWLETFGENRTKTALILSICNSMLSFIAPVVSILINRFGHRKIAVIGGVLTAVGVVATAFSPNIYLIYFTYGLVGAFGICMYYVSGLVILPLYFVKRKVLVMGLASVGGGVFSLVMPLVYTYFIRVYTWRGSMILQGGIMLHACVFGALLRPQPALPKSEGKQASQRGTLLNISLLKEFKFWLFFLSSLSWPFSFVLMAFGPDYSLECGYSKQQAAILLSVTGITSALCRLFTALLAGHPRCDITIIYTIGMTVRCIPVILLPLLNNYVYFIALYFVHGIGFGVHIALYAAVTESLFGLKRFASAYGYNFFAVGISALVGPPFAGYLHDRSDSYENAFYVSGGLSLISTILMAFIIVLDTREKKLKSAVPVHETELHMIDNKIKDDNRVTS